MKISLLSSASVIAAAIALTAPSAHAQSSCNELTNLSIPNTSVTAATPVTAGATVTTATSATATVTAPVDFCRVQITLTPVDGR